MGFKTYCGDSLKVLPKLIEEGTNVDFVFTSPPYNRLRNDKYKNYDDKKTDEEYLKFLSDFTDYSFSLLGDKGFLFHNNRFTYYNSTTMYDYIGKYSKCISNIFIQVINNPQPNDNYNKTTNDYSVTNSYEVFMILNKNKLPIRGNIGYNRNVIFSNVTKNPFSEIHNATMNPKVSDFFIKTFTKEGNTVLDPFMGLGTTGISCLKMNRNFIGIELCEEYFNVSNKRLKEIEVEQKNNLEFLFK